MSQASIQQARIKPLRLVPIQQQARLKPVRLVFNKQDSKLSG